MTIERSPTVFAAWNGAGVLTIGTPETLDPDDCVAQMILHETCHALIEGPDGLQKPDWGLDITDPAQKIREFSCLRLQAALTQQYGLRTLLASTTNFRSYYDQLPDDPLADDSDPAVPAAKAGMQRATTGSWSTPLADALRQTQQIANIVSPLARQNSLWSVVKQCDGGLKSDGLNSSAMTHG